VEGHAAHRHACGIEKGRDHGPIEVLEVEGLGDVIECPDRERVTGQRLVLVRSRVNAASAF
jgi:hypothetical protein